MIAIFKREFRACFTGVTGWLFMAVILALYGLYFFVYNLLSGYAYVAYTLSSMAFIMLIAVPVLTMRILSEDRHSRTDQLILTSPVPVWKIVLGKYLALAALFMLDMLLISMTPLVLSLYGTVPMGESYTAILGFTLFGLACIAVGVFVSGITESQIIAAVVCFVALFIGYMMPNLCTLISEGGNILTKILSCYDLYSPMGPFMAGTLDLTGVFYFLTLIAVALFLTVQMIEKRRWSMSVRRIGLGVFSIATIVLGIAIAVLANFGVRKIPTEYTSLDVTYNKLFALTSDTKNYVASLDRDVTIYVWSSENNTDTTVKETLDRYSTLSPHLEIKYITPSENPNFYTAYTENEPAASSLFVVSDLRSRVIDYDSLYEKSYDYYTYSSTIEAYDAEGQITSAIGYVTMESDNLPKVYVLEGHDETPLGDPFTEALAKSNISKQSLNLLQTDSVPDDCRMLIINGAMKDISKDDAAKINAYLENGGTVVLATSYDSGSQPNMENILSEFGITKSEGIVMEKDAGHVYSNIGYYLLPDISDSIYTGYITNGFVFTPYAAGLMADEEDGRFVTTPILTTSDKAVTMIAEEGSEDGQLVDEGPFYIGLAVIRTETPGTLIAFGSMDLFNADADAIVAGSNAQLFNGIINNHVITEDEVSDTGAPVIPSKSYTVENLVMNSATGAVVGVFIMILIPIGMIASGIAIWASRRKR